MIRSITGNWWGGEGSIPDSPIIFQLGAVSDTTNRITPGFTAHADRIEVWSSATEFGTYAQIGTILPTDTFFDDSTLTAETLRWYKLRAGAGAHLSAFSPAYACTTLSTEGVERNLWLNLTNFLKADIGLVGYIGLFKFDKESKILPESQYPILKGWVLRTEEMWLAVPKRKIVKLHFALHGLVQNRDTESLELEKLRMSEKIKNALERLAMDSNATCTVNFVDDAVFNNLDSYRAEVFVSATIWSKFFVAGNR
jgi:hypothetical protein